MNLSAFIELLARGVAGDYSANPLRVQLPDGRLMEVSDVCIQRDADPDEPANVVILVRA